MWSLSVIPVAIQRVRGPSRPGPKQPQRLWKRWAELSYAHVRVNFSPFSPGGRCRTLWSLLYKGLCGVCKQGTVWASDLQASLTARTGPNTLNAKTVEGEKYMRAEAKSQDSDREKGVVREQMTRTNLRAGQLRWKPLFNWQMTEVGFPCLCVSVVRPSQGSGISELTGPGRAGPRPSLPHPWWDAVGQVDTLGWQHKKNKPKQKASGKNNNLSDHPGF